MDPALGKSLYLETAKLGQLLIVERKVKRWAGLCLGIKKNPNAHILQLDVVDHWLLENGFWAQQIFDRQVVRFKRTPDTVVYVWSNGAMPEQVKVEAAQPQWGAAKQRREFRKAYRGVRTALMVERQARNEHFAYLELSEEVTAEEFKAKRREVMKQWHPDRLTIFVAEGGTPEEFNAASNRALAAISWVTQFLANKGTKV